MPRTPDPTDWLSASAPRAADTTTTIPSESPEPIEYLITGDMTYRSFYLKYSPPSTMISDVRPTITAVIAMTSRDATINLLAQYLRGGTVALLTKDGRTITANNVALDDLKNLSAELKLPKNDDGSYLALAVISCASTDYRSN